MQANHQSWLKASYHYKQTKSLCPEDEEPRLHPELAFSATEKQTGSRTGSRAPLSLQVAAVSYIVFLSPGGSRCQSSFEDSVRVHSAPLPVPSPSPGKHQEIRLTQK